MVNERGIQIIEALILEENKQSMRLHEKCGYVVEGLKRHAVYKGGAFHNQYVVAYVKE